MTMAIKHRIQNMMGPDAPRNLMNCDSISIGPVVARSKVTTQNAAKADNGTPMVAAKCCLNSEIIQLVLGSVGLKTWIMRTRAKQPPSAIVPRTAPQLATLLNSTSEL